MSWLMLYLNKILKSDIFLPHYNYDVALGVDEIAVELENTVPACMVEFGGTKRPGRIITPAPMAQLYPMTDPKCVRPVDTNMLPSLYLTISLFSNTLVVPTKPPNQLS